MPQKNTDTRTYRYDVGPDTGPHRNELDTDTWLYRNGIGPHGAGAGRGRPGPRHRKPPSRRMRRAAAASAIVLAGGGAAAGLLYATGPQPTLNGAADQSAHTVTSATRTGTPQGAATTLATPAAAGQPAQAYVPRHAASSGRHSAMIEKTVTATGPASPAGAISAPSPSDASSASSSSPSPSSPSASSPGTSPTASPSQPTADPTAPTASPSVSPPLSVSGGASCTDPSFSTSAAFGSETLGAYTVSNDMWNAGGGGIAQTLSACSSSDWNVDANIAADSGGVKTYPNSAYAFAVPPEISSLAAVTSTFGSTLPASGDFEDAYDIWLNGTAGTGGDEVMIWTDNHGQTPPARR